MGQRERLLGYPHETRAMPGIAVKNHCRDCIRMYMEEHADQHAALTGSSAV